LGAGGAQHGPQPGRGRAGFDNERPHSLDNIDDLYLARTVVNAHRAGCAGKKNVLFLEAFHTQLTHQDHPTGQEGAVDLTPGAESRAESTLHAAL